MGVSVELSDVGMQPPGQVMSDLLRLTGSVRRALPSSNRRQYLCRTAFSAANHAAPRRPGQQQQQQDRSPESRLCLLTADLHRRQSLAIVLAAVSSLSLPLPALAESSDAGELRLFSSQKQGYTMQIPAAWEQKSKSGADVLFVGKGADVGVTVSPIRINSLREFGTVEAVGDRLLGAEKAKESTESAAMLSTSSREGAQGTPIYTYDYKVDTTRGKKRIVSTVAIKDRKLYICNGTVKCTAPGLDCDPVGGPGVVEAVEAVSQSFDVL